MPSAVPYFPHDCQTFVASLSPFCDWSCQVYRTTRCQVVQFAPNTSISRQCVSKLLTILQLIPIPPFWTDGRPNKDEKLCKVALLSCLPIHSIAQRIIEHVLPCRRTTPLFVRKVFAITVISLLPQQKYVNRTFLCTAQWWLHWVCILFGCQAMRVSMGWLFCSLSQRGQREAKEKAEQNPTDVTLCWQGACCQEMM